MSEHQNWDPVFDHVMHQVMQDLEVHGPDAACRTLADARDTSRRAGDYENELFLTLLLATHLSGAGRDEEALAECQFAESLNLQFNRARLGTIRQLRRMKRDAEAKVRCEALLGEESLEPDERHETLATLGDLAIATDIASAREYLARALHVAAESDLSPVDWDTSLAAKLARQGDRAAIEYLRLLEKAALDSGDLSTRDTATQLLQDIGEDTSDQEV